jgi:phage baseplate assembly protein W
MATYRGFSTLVNKKKYSLEDYALAKQDLFNYFNTRKGSRLMNPNFGTIIWDMLFEPLDDDTQQIISDDVKRIVRYDPRLAVQSVSITEQTNGLQIQISLTYVPTDQSETFNLLFDQATRTMSTSSY